MMFKKKCSKCGAKNSKERTVCIECGAPIVSEQVESQVAHVSTEAEVQVKSTIGKKPEERIKGEHRDNEKILYGTIKQPAGHRESAWFGVGIVLLSISTLIWLILIPEIMAEPREAGDIVLGGIIITVIPIGIGIYCVRRGRKVPSILTCPHRLYHFLS